MSGKSKRRPHPSTLAPVRQGAISIVTGPGQTSIFTVDAWRLDPPDRDYHADVCTATIVSGSPNLHFGQTSVLGNLSSILSIVMGRSDLQRMVDAFLPVLANLDRHLANWSDFVATPFVSSEFKGEADRVAKFHASVVRGGCDPDFAMLDFYNRELIIPHRVAASPEEFDIRSVVRVRMAPPLLNVLFADIAKLGVPR